MKGIERCVGTARECGQNGQLDENSNEALKDCSASEARGAIRDTFDLIKGSFRRLLNGDRQWDGNIYHYSF